MYIHTYVRVHFVFKIHCHKSNIIICNHAPSNVPDPRQKILHHQQRTFLADHYFFDLIQISFHFVFFYARPKKQIKQRKIRGILYDFKLPDAGRHVNWAGYVHAWCSGSHFRIRSSQDTASTSLPTTFHRTFSKQRQKQITT